MNDVALLAADKLTKRFGGLAAVNEVSVKLYRDNIHAVIGPNGAGKSTLINLLSGDLQPTSGTILFGGTQLFDAAQMASLYVDKAGYMQAVSDAADDAFEKGFLLAPDVERIKAAAGLQWDLLGI